MLLTRSPLLVFRSSYVCRLAQSVSAQKQRLQSFTTRAQASSASQGKRALGNTGYDVFPLGLGASPLGAAYGVGAILYRVLPKAQTAV